MEVFYLMIILKCGVNIEIIPGKYYIMLSYHVSQSNSYTIRTEPTASNSFTMSLQDMTTQYNSTASLSGLTYNAFESMLGFTASISGSIIGSEYRAVIYNGSTSIWHGSVQVYMSSSLSIPKSDYQNQNTQYISHTSENKYVIID
jgi:hypothetical protein